MDSGSYKVSSGGDAEKGRFTHPAKVLLKKKFLKSKLSSFLRPSSVVDGITPDQICENIANDAVPETGHGNVSKEVAALCGEGSDGWVSSGHIMWLLHVINRAGRGTLGFCINTIPADSAISSLKKTVDLSTIVQLVFVVNVGKNADATVYLGGLGQPGNHWALALVPLGMQTPTVFYCDSLGWNYPVELNTKLKEYLRHFGVEGIEEFSVRMAHVPTPQSAHQCGSQCLNYPLQTCSNVCGVVVLICAAVAAFDPELLSYIMMPGKAKKIYLNFPTAYQKYLRVVLIAWLLKGNVDIKNISLKFIPQRKDDHVKTQLSVKRKLVSSPAEAHHQQKVQAVESSTKEKSSGTPSVPAVTPGEARIPILCAEGKFPSGTIPVLCAEGKLPSGTIPVLCAEGKLPSGTVPVLCAEGKLPSGTIPVLCAEGKLPSGTVPVLCAEGKLPSGTIPVLCAEGKLPSGTIPVLCAEGKLPSGTSPSCRSIATVEAIKEITVCTTSPTKDAEVRLASKSAAPARKHVCSFCSGTFASRNSLWRHKKRQHAEALAALQDKAPDVRIPCTECGQFKASTIQGLIKHQRSFHGKDIQIQIKSFSSLKEFHSWKEQIERDSKARYVKSYGSKSAKNKIITRYYCHRSGFYRPSVREKRSRSLKSQGTAKISTKCCSYITVRECISTRRVSVEYCLDHVGHAVELAHLKLSDELRTVIAGKLASGVDASKVLDDIRGKISDVDRDSLVTRRDINNIRKQYHLSNTEGPAHDCQSVGLWVQELREGTYDPIVVQKAPGEDHDTLKREDFLLGIQTEFQRDMMQKYAHKMICVDFIHSSTQYDFMLATILVVDDYGEGIPTAWAITNREDAEILEVFLNGLKTRGVQDYETDVFLSDLSNDFYNAWCETFTTPRKRLYCSCHVDKAWKRDIHSLVKSTGKRSEIYKHLKNLQVEKDETIFRKKLQDLLFVLQDTSPALYSHFYSNYVVEEKVQLWATCFRRGTLANTNAVAESFHRLLKGVLLKQELNTSVDNLLVILLKVSRDKAVDQLIKSQKGKTTRRLREIKKRHQNAEEVDSVTCIREEKLWSVTASGSQCTVEKVASHDSCKCKLVCDQCQVCVHMYSCTCADYLTKAVACKHIHAVHSTYVPVVDSDHGEDDQLQYFSGLLSNGETEVKNETDALRRSALLVINDLIDIVNDRDCNADTLRTACQRTKAVVTIVRGMKKVSAEHNH